MDEQAYPLLSPHVDHPELLMNVIRTLVKRHTTVGVRQTLGRLRREIQAQARHKAGVRRALKMTRPDDGYKINLGCGSKYKPGWVNVDLWNSSADVSLDLREPLPLPDDSVSTIYSEHLLEHFVYPGEVQRLLREALRVLIPGGVLHVVVPDHGALLRSYATGDMAFFQSDRIRSYLLNERATLMHRINYHVRQDGLHQFSYDEETLQQILRDAGFVCVRRRPFDPDLDSEHRRPVSLYMRATKPQGAVEEDA